MASFINRSGRFNSQHCACCDRQIRLLGDQQSLAFFLVAKGAQRRAHQCMNCGQVLCRDCSRNSFRCACGSNAWVALPYLEGSPVEAAEHQFV